MNLRTIPRAALGGYLKALRLPLDAAARLRRRGDQRSDAELAADRAEAAARDVAGAATLDEELRRDASRRHAATDERARAKRLRAEAERTTAQADSELAERQDAAERRRAEARERAQQREQSAERRRTAAKRGAAESEQKRKKAAARATAQAEETIDDRERRARLEQLEREAEALGERERALTASDEAKRLGDAAARKKAARKAS